MFAYLILVVLLPGELLEEEPTLLDTTLDVLRTGCLRLGRREKPLLDGGALVVVVVVAVAALSSPSSA